MKFRPPFLVRKAGADKTLLQRRLPSLQVVCCWNITSQEPVILTAVYHPRCNLVNCQLRVPGSSLTPSGTVPYKGALPWPRDQLPRILVGDPVTWLAYLMLAPEYDSRSLQV